MILLSSISFCPVNWSICSKQLSSKAVLFSGLQKKAPHVEALPTSVALEKCEIYLIVRYFQQLLLDSGGYFYVVCQLC